MCEEPAMLPIARTLAVIFMPFNATNAGSRFLPSSVSQSAALLAPTTRCILSS